MMKHGIWGISNFQTHKSEKWLTWMNKSASRWKHQSLTIPEGGRLAAPSTKKILHLQRDSSTQNLLLRCPSLGHFMTTVLYLSNGISWHFRMGGWYSLMGCSCFFSIFSWVFPIFFMGFCLRSNSKSCLTTACGIALRAPPQEGADERSTCNLWLVNFGMQKAIDRIRLDSLYIYDTLRSNLSCFGMEHDITWRNLFLPDCQPKNTVRSLAVTLGPIGLPWASPSPTSQRDPRIFFVGPGRSIRPKLCILLAKPRRSQSHPLLSSVQPIVFAMVAAWICLQPQLLVLQLPPSEVVPPHDSRTLHGLLLCIAQDQWL